ncbi:2-dehydropantoate 2-reductase [Chloroflexota bacterium]
MINNNTPICIAVIGAGAIGSYYGARLTEAGHDVRFLMRRDYQAVKQSGLKITSPDGDLILPNPNVFSNSTEIGKVDWILCSLKAISIDKARELIKPCLKPDTRIIVLMNGLGLEEKFARLFDPNHVFGGLAFTCINREQPGHVHHLAYGQVTIGHLKNDPIELERALALWSGSKVNVIISPSLLCERWKKLCWNIPFNGLVVAAGGITVDRIMVNRDLRSIARRLMEEVIMVGNKDLAAHFEKFRIERDDFIKSMFDYTDNMGAYQPSSLMDFLNGRNIEVEAIFGEPLRRAEQLHVDTPQLALLTALLREINTQLKVQS